MKHSMTTAAAILSPMHSNVAVYVHIQVSGPNSYMNMLFFQLMWCSTWLVCGNIIQKWLPFLFSRSPTLFGTIAKLMLLHVVFCSKCLI